MIICYFSLVIDACDCFCFVPWMENHCWNIPTWKSANTMWVEFILQAFTVLFAVISLANLTVYDNPTWFQGWFGLVSEFFKVIFLYLIYEVCYITWENILIFILLHTILSGTNINFYIRVPLGGSIVFFNSFLSFDWIS